MTDAVASIIPDNSARPKQVFLLRCTLDVRVALGDTCRNAAECRLLGEHPKWLAGPQLTNLTLSRLLHRAQKTAIFSEHLVICEVEKISRGRVGDPRSKHLHTSNRCRCACDGTVLPLRKHVPRRATAAAAVYQVRGSFWGVALWARSGNAAAGISTTVALRGASAHPSPVCPFPLGSLQVVHIKSQQLYHGPPTSLSTRAWPFSLSEAPGRWQLSLKSTEGEQY